MRMVQVITRKKRRVFTDFEWKMLWIAMFTGGALAGSTVTYLVTRQSKKPDFEIIEEKPVIEVDTANLYQEELHFDCYVIEKILGNEGTMYITECGVPFYSKMSHEVGDTLPNFKSPKHE
jgi:hypothetical protein